MCALLNLVYSKNVTSGKFFNHFRFGCDFWLFPFSFDLDWNETVPFWLEIPRKKAMKTILTILLSPFNCNWADLHQSDLHAICLWQSERVHLFLLLCCVWWFRHRVPFSQSNERWTLYTQLFSDWKYMTQISISLKLDYICYL